MEGFPPKSELVTAFVEHGVGETEPECELGPQGPPWAQHLRQVETGHPKHTTHAEDMRKTC